MHTLVVMRSFHAHLSNLTFRQVNVCYSKSTGTVLLRKQPPLLWQGFFTKSFVAWLQLLSLLQLILAVQIERASDSSGCCFRSGENDEMWSRKVSLSDIAMNLTNYLLTLHVLTLQQKMSNFFPIARVNVGNVQMLKLYVSLLQLYVSSGAVFFFRMWQCCDWSC